jgi:hypothetical protein
MLPELLLTVFLQSNLYLEIQLNVIGQARKFDVWTTAAGIFSFLFNHLASLDSIVSNAELY